MQSLNILIACQGKSKFAEVIKQSSYLNKLFATSDEEIEGAISIKFNTFKELAQKCKKLQVDIVLVECEKWIFEGIASVMKQFFINCFAATTDWIELSLSHNHAREILTKYGINVPPIVNLPLEFPIIVKGDGVLKIANSMQEIISIKENAYNISSEVAKSIFLEKFLNGKKYKVISIFDGKHVLTFPQKELNSNLIKEYSKKLENMLTKEKADFIGFINSYLIEDGECLYNTSFSFDFDIPNLEACNLTCPKDILYICILAIYQKLNEIEELSF